MTTTDTRGFLGYAQFDDTYGAQVRVKESSSANGPHVWIFVGGGRLSNNDGSAHLTIEQAVLVRDALDRFIKDHSQ